MCVIEYNLRASLNHEISNKFELDNTEPQLQNPKTPKPQNPKTPYIHKLFEIINTAVNGIRANIAKSCW